MFTTTDRSPVDGFGPAKVRLDAFIAGKTGAPIPGWWLHDLRRIFATGCARLGVAIHVVEKCLNNSSGTFRGIVSVYQKHDFASEQRAAVEAWARFIEGLVSDENPGSVACLTRRR